MNAIPPLPVRTPQDKLPKLLHFMRLVWGVDHALQSISKRMHKAIGLTGPQRLVIRVVGRYPQISAGQLAELLHMHPSTLTGVLRRLESQDILRRKPDNKDGRRSLFVLTPRGKAFDVKHPISVEAVCERLLHRFDEKHVDMTRDVLEALTEALMSASEQRPAAKRR